jgi:hypothetical protein
MYDAPARELERVRLSPVLVDEDKLGRRCRIRARQARSPGMAACTRATFPPGCTAREVDIADRWALRNYSSRNASTGSTRSARRAGMRQAISAELSNTTAPIAKDSGSVRVTPYS